MGDNLNMRMDKKYDKMGDPFRFLIFLVGFCWFFCTEFSTSFIALFFAIKHVDRSATSTISYEFTKSL